MYIIYHFFKDIEIWQNLKYNKKISCWWEILRMPLQKICEMDFYALTLTGLINRGYNVVMLTSLNYILIVSMSPIMVCKISLTILTTNNIIIIHHRQSQWNDEICGSNVAFKLDIKCSMNAFVRLSFRQTFIN